jgi:hypothetical protein
VLTCVVGRPRCERVAVLLAADGNIGVVDGGAGDEDSAAGGELDDELAVP